MMENFSHSEIQASQPKPLVDDTVVGSDGTNSAQYAGQHPIIRRPFQVVRKSPTAAK